MKCTTLLVSLALVGFAHAAEPDPAPKEVDPSYGFAVGERVPNRGMRVVFGKHDGVHTCLTGKYRSRRAISVYASVLDEDVFRVMKVVDDALAGRDEDRGFLLFIDRNLTNENRARQLGGRFDLESVDVAFASRTKGWRNLDFTKRITVVDSDQRLVRSSTTFEAAKDVTEKSLAALRATLARDADEE